MSMQINDAKENEDKLFTRVFSSLIFFVPFHCLIFSQFDKTNN